MLYFFSNNCALVGENVSCYYLSRRIAIVLLPVAAQSDGQSSTIAGYHGLSLAVAAGTGLSLSTRQAATQFGLSSSTTAAALSTNRHNWSSSSINRAQCSVVRRCRASQLTARRRTPQGVWFNYAPAVTPAISWRMDTANMFSCF